MRVEREIETKLAVPDAFVLPSLSELEGVTGVAVRTLRLKATYWDSQDHRLARSGITLRHRTGEGRPQWTLKTAAEDGRGRMEHTVQGTGTRVPVDLVAQVAVRLRGEALAPVAELRTTRDSRLLLDLAGTELAEVVDDTVRVTGGASWRELEVEERADSAVGARALELLVRAGAVVGSQQSKAHRAMGAAASGPPDLGPLPAVGHKGPAGDVVRWSLRHAERLIVEHDPGVRSGRDDAVHQLRVACRRLRSDLRTFRSLLNDERVPGLRAELQWIGGELGAARDLEVLRANLRLLAGRQPALEAGPVDDLLAVQEATALDRGRQALASPRYAALLRLLHEVAAEPHLTTEAERRAGRVLPELLDQAWKPLRNKAKRLDVLDESDRWHRVRILAKRARYAAEAVEQTVPNQVHGTARRAKKAQTRLGEHQDAAVLVERLTALAAVQPEVALLCGCLVEREQSLQTARRRDFLRARKSLRLR